MVVDLTVLEPQALTATTLKAAEAKEAGIVRLMVFVPCPLLMVDPAGTVQL
jgi:hypothetical protein